MSTPAITQDESFVPFTKAERIRQLNDIDKSITQLLKSAGLALKILVANQQSQETVADRKKAFENATDGYLSTLHSVDLGLKRQIWGLEEAEIIVEKKMKDSQDSRAGSDGKAEKDLEGTVKLDIGWLNSRSGKVGRDNEAELWAQARSFLQGVNQNWGEGGKTNEDEDQDMGN